MCPMRLGPSMRPLFSWHHVSVPRLARLPIGNRTNTGQTKAFFSRSITTKLTMKDTKMTALRDALKAHDPFYTGICTIPEYQRFLYYSDRDALRRIDFSNASTETLEELYGACKPAEFGLNGENVFDTSYRKARKMDLVSFATLFDPRSLGIDEQVSKALLTETHATMRMELYKLNVYGEGDFFKVHKDTPRARNMFGSLVVVLPTPHEGGQFVLHQSDKEWTIDFRDEFSNATEPSVCFIAFYGGVEHAVAPVTSGHRVTLTYNLYSESNQPTSLSIPTPSHLKLRQALVDLVNDKSTLPNGGYLGFGLLHEYVHSGYDHLGSLPDQLKGSDRALVDVCNELGLRYHFKLLYRNISGININLLTDRELKLREDLDEQTASDYDYLAEALKGFIDYDGLRAEGFVFVGQGSMPDHKELEEEVVGRFYKKPWTEVLEVTEMKSSVDAWCAMVRYGNEASLDYFYGTACMVVAVEPAESRKPIGP